MKRTLLILLWMEVCIPLGAQITHRDSVLTQARYLKSIYRTDDAIDMLSTLVQPGAMDDAVLSELADCHFQSGDYEGAVQAFQRQEDIGNDSYPIHYYLGQSYWHTQVTYRAEKELIAA